MTRAARALVALFAGGGAIVACQPDFAERESFVGWPRVVAIRIEPPEVAPGERFTATLLVAGPDGPIVSPRAAFALCTTPKPLTENGSVAEACQRDGVLPVGEGDGSIEAVVPADACATFGPEVHTEDLRPRDADATGGYYQPIRARLVASGEAITAFGFVRVTCGLANATAEAATRYREEYRVNTTPRLGPIEARIDGALVPLDAVPAGARVMFRAAWRPEDAEGYVVLEPATQAIVPRRESLRVSWLATDGTFENDRTGRDEGDLATTTENAWTAPTRAGTAHVLVVLRDARGGTSFEAVRLRTR